MKLKFKDIKGSIVAPEGFLASGVFCDIKRLGTGKGSEKGNKADLALIVSEVPATVAGMFTTNQVCAAPVKVCVERAGIIEAAMELGPTPSHADLAAEAIMTSDTRSKKIAVEFEMDGELVRI